MGLRLLRGESLDALSLRDGETGLGALPERVSFWKRSSGHEEPRRRPESGAALEQELKLVMRQVADLMMDKELLEIRIARFESELPFLERGSYP
jgi:hypothetical protein